MDKYIECAPREEINQLSGFTTGRKQYPSQNPIAMVRIQFEPDDRYPKGFYFYGDVYDSTRYIHAMFDASELHHKPFGSAQEAADAIQGWLDNIAKCYAPLKSRFETLDMMHVHMSLEEMNAYMHAYSKYSKIGNCFDRGILPVKNEDGWGGINSKGEVVIPLIYNDSFSFNDSGFARVFLARHKCGLIDTTGKERIPCIYDNILGYYSDGFARVCKDCYFGTIDKDGKMHITPEMQFQEISLFYNGVAAARIGTKWGLIDTEGNHISDFMYFAIEAITHEVFDDIVFLVRKTRKIYNIMLPDGQFAYDTDFEGTL